MKLVKYITGKEGQEIIGQYGVAEFEEPLFIPDAQEDHQMAYLIESLHKLTEFASSFDKEVLNIVLLSCREAE